MSAIKQIFGEQLPKLVMFDLDGTLIDSVPDMAAAVNVMLEKIGRQPIAFSEVRKWVGNGALILMQRALASSIDYSSVSEAEAEQVLELFLDAYAKEVTRTKLYPNIIETLDKLRSLDIPLAVVTNKPQQFLPELFRKYGLDGYFSWVVGGDSLPVRKPDPAGLNWVMQQAGVTPEQAVFVGDSKSDVVASRAAGVACVALTYGYNHGIPIADYNPDLVIDDMSELIS